MNCFPTHNSQASFDATTMVRSCVEVSSGNAIWGDHIERLRGLRLMRRTIESTRLTSAPRASLQSIVGWRRLLLCDSRRGKSSRQAAILRKDVNFVCPPPCSVGLPVLYQHTGYRYWTATGTGCTTGAYCRSFVVKFCGARHLTLTPCAGKLADQDSNEHADENFKSI